MNTKSKMDHYCSEIKSLIHLECWSAIGPVKEVDPIFHLILEKDTPDTHDFG